MKLITLYKAQKTKRGAFIIVMKENLQGRKKRLGGLPFPPYGANITSDVSTAAGSFKIPDFQPLNDDSIASNTQNVNYCSF